jgi:hypothetical protein
MIRTAARFGGKNICFLVIFGRYTYSLIITLGEKLKTVFGKNIY